VALAGKLEDGGVVHEPVDGAIVVIGLSKI
jgi:hypothetical protein